LKPEARGTGGAVAIPEGTIGLSALAAVEFVGRIEQEDRLPALESLHVWTPETVEKRFHYRQPGLWVLGVRVFRRESPVALPVTAEHAGCKTWVPLEVAPATAGLVPSLGDEEFAERMHELRSALGPGSAGRRRGSPDSSDS
jgi:hypothetical protein